MIFNKDIHKNIKVVALDLEGTLTQHKQPLESANKEAPDKLAFDPDEIGTKIQKKLKKLSDSFRKSRQRRTVPEGTVRALMVVIMAIKLHNNQILL